jgi:hypothetical protein
MEGLQARLYRLADDRIISDVGDLAQFSFGNDAVTISRKLATGRVCTTTDFWGARCLPAVCGRPRQSLPGEVSSQNPCTFGPEGTPGN